MLLKAKDYVTLGNIACGFVSVVFVIKGDLTMAGYAILFSLFFDIGDGWVARLTKQFNKFGSELDNVADLISYSVAPSFLIYGFYTSHPTFEPLPWWLAAIVASLPLMAGCIRMARFNVKRIHYEGVWFGFPRPAAAFLYVGYVNSSIGQASELMYYMGIFVVAYSSYMHFVLIPFVNHHRDHHPRWLKWSYWFIGSSTFFAAVGHAITGISLTWDVATFWLLSYLFVHRFIAFDMDELAELKRFANEWKEGESEIT